MVTEERPFLSIVIPAHNEEKRLPDTLNKVFGFLDTQQYAAEVLVVENGSQDTTLKIALEFASHDSRLQVIQETAKGKGRAVQRGMLEARGEYRFMADADLSMPIGEVNRFFPPELEGIDVAIGSRESLGAVRYNEPVYRHLGGRAINLIIRLLALPDYHDTQCGFKCFRAAVAEDLFRRQSQMGWAFDVEILYIARLRHYKIVEVPIDWYFNPESKLNVFRDALRMILDIWSIRKNTRNNGM